MRIALIKKNYSIKSGGSEKYCVLLARGLSKRGHCVTVIGEQIDAELVDEVSFVPVRVNSLTSWTKNCSFAVNAGQAARRGRFDVVYSLGRAHGADVVQVMERVQSHRLNVYYQPAIYRKLQTCNPRHRALIGLEKQIYRDPSVRTIVTQSDLDRRLLRKYYQVANERIQTIHNGADLDRFHLGVQRHQSRTRHQFGIPEDVPLISFAAMDFQRKGLAAVLTAMAACQLDHLHLLVVGAGGIRAFSRISRRLGLRQRVHFVGHRHDIELCFGASDLFVYPTLYEPFPTVVIEAMACGLPAVTTRDTGAADLIDESRSGYFISEDDPVRGIARCLDYHFSRTATEHQQMATACANRVRGFTMDAVVDQTESLLIDLAAQKLAHGRQQAA